MGDRTLDEPGRSVDRPQALISNTASTSASALSGRCDDADRRARMAASVAEQFGDEIGRAVHRLGQGVEGRGDIEEPAEPHHLRDPVEIAERRVRLGEHVDDAEPGRLARGVDRGIGRELALVALGELAVRPERKLAGDEQKASRRARTKERSWRPAPRASAERCRAPSGAWRFRSSGLESSKVKRADPASLLAGEGCAPRQAGGERVGGSFLAYVASPAKASLFLPLRALRFAAKEWMRRRP